MSINTRYFPEGKTKALTMSYDDGSTGDRRLVEIFNKHGIKGTFHINSGSLTNDWHICKEEMPALFKGHEVSAHGKHHPNYRIKTKAGILDDILDDKKRLEDIMGYPVRGMSYPYGVYDNRVLQMLPVIGIEYARTVNSINRFDLPSNYLEWHPTCHHNGDILEKAKSFLEPGGLFQKVFYVWGHSHEFNNQNNWNIIEEFCEFIGGKEEVWYATNIEILDYVNAVNNLRTSADESIIYNPSAIPVWIEVDGGMVKVGAGETYKASNG